MHLRYGGYVLNGGLTDAGYHVTARIDSFGRAYVLLEHTSTTPKEYPHQIALRVKSSRGTQNSNQMALLYWTPGTTAQSVIHTHLDGVKKIVQELAFRAQALHWHDRHIDSLRAVIHKLDHPVRDSAHAAKLNPRISIGEQGTGYALAVERWKGSFRIIQQRTGAIASSTYPAQQIFCEGKLYARNLLYPERSYGYPHRNIVVRPQMPPRPEDFFDTLCGRENELISHAFVNRFWTVRQANGLGDFLHDVVSQRKIITHDAIHRALIGPRPLR